MCIAILNSPNVTFPKSLIQNCWDNNRDGGGMIWTTDGINQLNIFKEVKNFQTFYNKYVEIRKQSPLSNIVLHFRISTSGGVNETNTHPFAVNKDLAFVHNGIISELNGINANKSDTNLFNEQYLRKLPSDFIYNDAILLLIKKFIGSSKLLFLNNLNEYTIVNENLGVRDTEFDGCWFSNSTYKKVNYTDFGGQKIYNTANYPKPKFDGKWSDKTIVWDKDLKSHTRYGIPHSYSEISKKWNPIGHNKYLSETQTWEVGGVESLWSKELNNWVSLKWVDNYNKESAKQSKEWAKDKNVKSASVYYPKAVNGESYYSIDDNSTEDYYKTDNSMQKRFDYLNSKEVTTLTTAEWSELEELKWWCI
jgi:hypothetical protein